MSISSLSLANASRASIQRIQSALKDATTEATSLRHADVGRTLGQLTGNAVSYRAQDTSISRLLASNKLVSTRLDLTNDALSSIATNGDGYQAALINGTATGSGVEALVTTAKQGLQQVLGALNTSADGQYLFAGTQSDVQPMLDGAAGTDAIKADFDDYLGLIGATRATVSADQVSAYVAGTTITADASGTPLATPRTFKFDNLFNNASDPTLPSAGWDANWSDASSTTATARISKSEVIASTVSSNETAIRQTVSAYAMVAALGIESMGSAARAQVLSAAQARLTAGKDGLTKLQADIGVRQTRIEAADAALTTQQDVVQAAFTRLEGVDETEAALRLNNLKTQLDTAYAVTGKLQGLSLLNYL